MNNKEVITIMAIVNDLIVDLSKKDRTRGEITVFLCSPDDNDERFVEHFEPEDWGKVGKLISKGLEILYEGGDVITANIKFEKQDIWDPVPAAYLVYEYKEYTLSKLIPRLKV